ncbi:MAG: hypothetical protein COT85_05445 [Chlamydiae bacterium CG10_big_fil_rev_8_21_14_0_10_42_34]|nr:MAG: hypothetical protein COT85_05445 [Chlamydiae bacterium CG10_big_fil_rev_8_21_14_0_10_42_34]
MYLYEQKSSHPIVELLEKKMGEGLNLKDHKLIHAAVDVTLGDKMFHMGDSNQWYGQCIDGEKVTFSRNLSSLIRSMAGKLRKPGNERHKQVVESIRVETLLKDYHRIQSWINPNIE